jgi:hypothetical protein
VQKSEAEGLVLKQWRALPPSERKTLEQALAFADRLATVVSFETVGNPKSIIRAWVIREFQGGSGINQAIRDLRAGPKPSTS